MSVRLVRLTKRERQKLALALHLATEWERSLADANTPDAVYGPPRGMMRETIRRCQANIRQFEALRRKLSEETDG